MAGGPQGEQTWLRNQELGVERQRDGNRQRGRTEAERGGGNGNQCGFVFNPSGEESGENFPLSSPETSLARQAFSLLRRYVLFYVFFFSFISKLSKLQMLSIERQLDSLIPLDFSGKISWLCLSPH